MPSRLAYTLCLAPCLSSLALVACGSDPAPTPPDVTSVAVDTRGTVLAAVVDDGSSIVSTGPGGSMRVDVSGPYHVVRVCKRERDATFVAAALLTPGDELPANPCAVDDTTGAVPVTVTSKSGEEIRVSIGRQSPRDGSTEIAVLPGTYDVVAIATGMSPPRVVIQRDVAITGATTLTIDVAAGQPMVTRPLDSGPDTFVTALFETARGTLISLPIQELAERSNISLVPADQLRAGDRQSVGLAILGGDRDASRTVTVDAAATGAIAIEVPAAIQDAKLAMGPRPTLSWTVAGEWQDRFARVSNTGSQPRLTWQLFASGAWVDAAGAPDRIEYPDLASIPGWNTAWNHDAEKTIAWEIDLLREDATSSDRVQYFTDTLE